MVAELCVCVRLLFLEGYLHREKSVWAGEVEEKGGAYSGFSADILHSCVFMHLAFSE